MNQSNARSKKHLRSRNKVIQIRLIPNESNIQINVDHEKLKKKKRTHPC